MRIIRKILIFFFVAVLITPLFTINQIYAQNVPEINVKTAILVDSGSGKILYAKNIDEPLPPASMTKMMAEYIVLEYINEGKINWNDTVTASEYASWLGATGGSAVYLAKGEKHTVKNLFDAMAVASANDATVALAEYIAQTETNFVKLMNEKAKEMGMEQTHFLTSTGYPADELGIYTPDIDGEHIMSARDSAILAWHLINDYPQSIEINGQSSIEFRPGNIFKSWNFMLPGLIYEYEGVDGLKTGHTTQAGYCFTSTIKRDDTRLISVIFGADSHLSRFNETKKLLEYGLSNYGLIELVSAKEPIDGFETIPIEKGKKTELLVAPKNTFKILVKNGENDLYSPIISLNDSVVAPIKSGDSVGNVYYTYNGEKEYEYLNEYIRSYENVELIAMEDVDKASWARLLLRKIATVTENIFSSVVDGVKNIF